jgi:hypothetical protein
MLSSAHDGQKVLRYVYNVLYRKTGVKLGQIQGNTENIRCNV